MTAVKLVTQETLTDCGLACVAMVSGKSLEAVRKFAVKELGYPKDGPYTTTHDNLYKLLAHFGIGHGKKAPFKSLAAMPSLAIMETRKMPSTGNSHLVVFERLPDGDERVLDPGFWLKQQERRDWNRIKLDTFVPVLVGEQSGTPKKSGKKAAAESVEPASNDDKAPSEKKAKPVKVTAAKEARQKPKPTTAKKAPKPAAVADGGVQPPDAASAQPDATAEAPAEAVPRKAQPASPHKSDAMVLEQLLLQPLRRIELIQPWRAAGNRPGVVGDSVLAGAMALHFETSALVFRSPLRFSACQTGTVIGFRSDGAVQTLGYRFDVVPSEDVGGLFGACEPRLSLTSDQWPGLCHVGKAQSVFLLADLGQHGGANFLRLRLLDRGWCSVMYRRDLDGAIELSPQDERAEVPSISVCSPYDEFGWLHPASSHPFVLDGQYWRTAHPRDWPWPLAKEWQSQPAGVRRYDLMRRVLLAKFQQHADLRRRLGALQVHVKVSGLPDGLVQDVASRCANSRHDLQSP